MAEFTSKGQGNLNTVLGAIGTAGATGILNGMGIFGNANCNGDNSCVNRYEIGMQRELTNKDMEISYLRGRDAAKTDTLEAYKYVDSRFREMEARLAEQAIINQKTSDSFALAAADLAAVKHELKSDIKLESERRCCADNAIVNYANATFYPKMVADVTVGTTSVAQILYNPIPDCGCCN